MSKLKSKKDIANVLISLGCLQISPERPFVYASGLKGPLYCDNRKLLSFVDERNVIVQAFVQEIQEKKWDFDRVAALATAAIPYGTLIADRMKRPLIYIRAKAKGHGNKKQLEGLFQKGERVILIEDLVNQAQSLMVGIEGVRKEGLLPVACFSIVDYEMRMAQSRLQKMNVPFYSLTDFQTILNEALKRGVVSSDGFQKVMAWHKRLNESIINESIINALMGLATGAASRAFILFLCSFLFSVYKCPVAIFFVNVLDGLF